MIDVGEVAVLGPLAVEVNRVAVSVVLQHAWSVIDHSSVPVVPLMRKPLSFWAPMVICEAAMVAIAAVVELGQHGEVVVERPARDERLEPAATRVARSPATNRTNS